MLGAGAGAGEGDDSNLDAGTHPLETRAEGRLAVIQSVGPSRRRKRRILIES
jgi:hypothetical protein